MLENKKYEILTKKGWCDFEGIQNTGFKKIARITTENNKHVSCTLEHELFNEDGKHVKAEDLNCGDIISTSDGFEKIVSIDFEKSEKNCYDIIKVNNSNNSFLVNEGVESSNCDELAFVRKNIANKFWTAVYPTISCLASDTIILTDDGFECIERYFDNKLVGDYFEISNLRTWGRYGFEDVSHGYVSPESETIVISLSNGQSIEVTHEHPLWSNKYKEDGEMIEAQNLEIGDSLRIEKGMNKRGSVGVSSRHFMKHFRHDWRYVLNVSEECLFEIIDECNGSIYCPDHKHVNALCVMLNNYGYDYTYNNKNIHVGMRRKDLRYEWIRIVSIMASKQTKTYDFTVPDTHTFLQNGILGSNTGGKCIITSTPTTDDSLFAHIWKLANKTVDDHGNELERGINGFKALEVKWDEHPERDESFKLESIRQFGEEKFRREHELEFIPEDETLINPIKLSQLEDSPVIQKTKGEIRWYKKLDREKLYLIGYDPSLGTGGDYSAIEIYEFPSMIQVGEWMHNMSDIPEQLNILRRILKMFEEAGFDEDNVRWTIENNSVGEAPLVLIEEYGEENFFGYFMSEPYNPMTRTQRRRFRKGYNTNSGTKLTACTRFKRWLENDTLKVSSRALIDQLSHFVSRGKTYAAQTGEHDDLVMASMLVVRMAMEIMKEEDEYMEELGYSSGDDLDGSDDDDHIPPLPVY